MASSHPEDGQEGKLGWTGLTQVHLGEAPPKGDDLGVLQLEGLREDGGSAA